MLHGGPQAATRRTASTPRQEAASNECALQKESTGGDLSQNGYGEQTLCLSLSLEMLVRYGVTAVFFLYGLCKTLRPCQGEPQSPCTGLVSSLPRRLGA